MNIETWKPIAGYEGFYEISDFGNVQSIGRTVATEEIVLKIRHLYATIVPSQLKLSKMFGISTGAIWYMVNLKTWKHI